MATMEASKDDNNELAMLVLLPASTSADLLLKLTKEKIPSSGSFEMHC